MTKMIKAVVAKNHSLTTKGMKKIKLIVLFTLFFNIVDTHAQTSVTDTLQYLQNSIVANKSNYVGKPLDSLLKDLQLNVVYVVDGLFPEVEASDTLSCEGLVLYFDEKEFSPEMIFKKSQRTGPNPVNFHIKSLEVVFLNPVPVLKSRVKPYDLLGWWWTQPRKTFWSSQIVGDLIAHEN